MPTVTDTLRTVLQIDGLSNYLSGLRQAQQGSLQAALQVQQLHENLRGLPRLLDQLGQALGIQTGQWALLATGMYLARSAINQIRQTVKEAMGDFEKYNAALFKTSFLFNAMGASPGIGALRGFARARAAQTGIPEEETLDLAARARQTGFSPATIGRLVPLAQDVQTSGLTSAQNVLDILNRLIHQEGRGRGSLGAINEAATQLRLDPTKFTGGQQHDLQEALRQLSERVGGLSEKMGHTISGEFLRNQTLLNMTMSRLGGLIEASLVPIIKVLNAGLEKFTAGFDAVIHTQLSPLQRGAAEGLSGALQFSNPLLSGMLQGLLALQDQEAIAGGKQDETNKILNDINRNLQNVPSAIALSIFGSASAFTRQAQSFRNFGAAINARF